MGQDLAWSIGACLAAAPGSATGQTPDLSAAGRDYRPPIPDAITAPPGWAWPQRWAGGPAWRSR